MQYDDFSFYCNLRDSGMFLFNYIKIKIHKLHDMFSFILDSRNPHIFIFLDVWEHVFLISKEVSKEKERKV